MVAGLGLRSAALLLLTAVLAMVPAPAPASPPYWTITDYSSAPVTIAATTGRAQVGAFCPDGQTPISGHTTMSPGGDVRRLDERIQFGSKQAYLANVANNSNYPIAVTATVRCVPVSTFSGAYPVSAEKFVHNGLQEANTQCNGTDFALSYEVTFNTTDSTVLYSYPNGPGWSIDGWADGVVGPNEKMTVTVHCITAADAAGLADFNATVSNTQWGSAASATCGANTRPILGGNRYLGDDFTTGAIMIDGRPTASGWTSTALSLEGGTTSTRVWCMPTVPPTLSVTAARDATFDDRATWTITPGDPAAAGFYDLTVTCRLTANGVVGSWETCGSSSASFPYPASGLGEGVHGLGVRVTTSDGRQAEAQVDVRIDNTAPTVAMTAPTARFTVGSASTARWTRSDAGYGIAGSDVRWRRAPFNGAFGAWSAPEALGPTAQSRAYSGLLPGSTYCFSVRAHDNGGAWTNTSAWAPQTCTTIPLDERSLTRSSGWTASTHAGWFRRTALSTRTRGASLLARGAIARRVAVTALACPTCGRVAVFVGNSKVGEVNLAARTTVRRTVVLPAFASRTGTVSLRVLSSGRLVRVDALGVSRY